MPQVFRYSHVAGVAPQEEGDVPRLRTAAGGDVVVDRLVLALWRAAAGQSLDELLAHFPAPPEYTRAGLACLAQAGLLQRNPEPAPLSTHAQDLRQDEAHALVSVILVSYNSLAWLPGCLESLRNQSYPALEVILVDNASSDDTSGWAATQADVTCLRLERSVGLAKAINRGIAAAHGAYLLILNPDIVLDPHCVAEMVRAAAAEERCAAVAAKLRLMWAPAFLNGLGNSVAALGWGVDNGLGHLDLGQFDAWEQVPSACFAATLIPAAAWQALGTLDEGLPMYYEDSEWSYRARLWGWQVRLAAQAVVYHAYSGGQAGAQAPELSPTKLRRVIYGRLRFAVRLLGAGLLLRFLAGYALEDGLRFGGALLRRRWAQAKAHLQGWRDFLGALPALLPERRRLQAGRRVPDRVIFDLQRQIPAAQVRAGQPLLTWDLVCNLYAPLLSAGKTNPVPEYPPQTSILRPAGWLARLPRIWRQEGPAAVSQRLGRQLRAWLAKA